MWAPFDAGTTDAVLCCKGPIDDFFQADRVFIIALKFGLDDLANGVDQALRRQPRFVPINMPIGSTGSPGSNSPAARRRLSGRRVQLGRRRHPRARKRDAFDARDERHAAAVGLGVPVLWRLEHVGRAGNIAKMCQVYSIVYVSSLICF